MKSFPLNPESLPEVIKAYCAGIMDGEGTIQINRLMPRSPRQHSPSFGLVVSVTNTVRSLIDYLHLMWGGSCLVSVKPKGNKRAAYRWYITGTRAAKFLEVLLPYMIIKRSEALVAIDFQAGIVRGPKRLTPDTIQKRQASMNRLSALKGRVHFPHLLGITVGTPVPKTPPA